MVTFEEWNSGKVQLENEYFEAVYGEVIGYTFEKEKIVEHRRLIGFQGEQTGIMLGTWFAEVCEY